MIHKMKNKDFPIMGFRTAHWKTRDDGCFWMHGIGRGYEQEQRTAGGRERLCWLAEQGDLGKGLPYRAGG
jgi:hypothetical protein